MDELWVNGSAKTMLNTVLIQQGRGGLQFSQPVNIVVATQADQVIPALQLIEAAVNQHHLYAAGFLCYEAAAAYDLAVHDPLPDVPLLWFGLYEQAMPVSYTHLDVYKRQVIAILAVANADIAIMGE